jgi:pyruvate kinase
MLSEETTLGDFPVEAVEVMTRIAFQTENDLLHHQLLAGDKGHYKSAGESVAASAVKTAERVDAKCIVALTERGYGASMTSRHRSQKPIIAITPNKETFNKVNLLFGVYPVMIDRFSSFDEALRHIKPLLLKEKLVKKGDKVVVVTGVPFGKVRESNTMMVEVM